MRALYQDLATSDLQRAPNANTGLWYDKYCDWPVKNGQVDWDLSSYKEGNREINPKQGWIETVAGQKTGDDKAIAAACQRLNQLAEKIWGIEKPQIFKTQWRFVSGLGGEHPVENGFAWHHTLGVPYLPGSSVKGMVRAWAEHWLNEDKDDIGQILGPRQAGEVGSVLFFDALPMGEVQLETDIMTPHYGPYYSEGEAPGDWHDPVPIPFLTVAANQTFQFLIAPRHRDCEQSRQDAETARGWLRDALEWIGAGAKTAVGYGRFERNIDAEIAIQEKLEKKKQEQDKIQKLKTMEPFDRKIEEIITSASGQKPYILLLNYLDSENLNEEEAKNIACRIRDLMKEAKVWKEHSKAKRPDKDKDYLRTKKIMYFIGGI